VRRIIAGLDRGLVALAHGGAQEYRDDSNWSCAERRLTRTTSGRPTTPRVG
jgi:hypothetical protein